jgi:hypothetical protein
MVPIRREFAKLDEVRVVFFAGVLAACGARTDLGGQRSDASVPPVTELQGVVVNDCAPNDGPAIAFALALPGASVIPSCPLPVVSALSIRISIWVDIPTAPGTYTLGDGSFASGAIADYCPFQGQCVAATSGTLTLTTFDATSATGFFSLVMPDQTTMTGKFTAISVCHNPLTCG